MTTRALTNRYASLRFSELPPRVVTRVSESVLDILGCMIAGHRLPSSATLLGLTDEVGGSPQSVVLGGPRASAPWAAYANAASAHAVELDDTDNSSSLHPGNVVVPATLALAESIGATGEQAAVAIVAGYDAMIRIGQASCAQAQYERGFHPTATCGVFGAAVAASSLLGLDGERMAHALGISGSLAAGSLEYIDEGSWTKRLQVGAAAQNGVLAAILASRGYTGPSTILEGRFGFLHAYTGSTNLSPLTANLEEPYAILGVSIKAFACCRYCQAPIDGLLQLRERNGFSSQDVEWIDVGLVSAGVPIVAEPRDRKLNPTNSVDAQFSLPYALAVALARGSAGLDDFSPKAIADPVVRRLMPLVRTHGEDELDAQYPLVWPARVTVGLSDGRVSEILLSDCRGDPSRPLTSDQLVQKFMELSQAFLGEEGATRLAATVATFSELDNVTPVMVLANSPRMSTSDGGGERP
jgi:2-methylcitrate dehydratase PrpD